MRQSGLRGRQSMRAGGPRGRRQQAGARRSAAYAWSPGRRVCLACRVDCCCAAVTRDPGGHDMQVNALPSVPLPDPGGSRRLVVGQLCASSFLRLGRRGEAIWDASGALVGRPCASGPSGGSAVHASVASSDVMRRRRYSPGRLLMRSPQEVRSGRSRSRWLVRWVREDQMFAGAPTPPLGRRPVSGPS